MPVKALPREWLRTLIIYLATMALGNLAWEVGHLPLYAIWRDGTLGSQVFAVVHNTTSAASSPTAVA